MAFGRASLVLLALTGSRLACAEPRERNFDRERVDRSAEAATDPEYVLGEPYWYGWQVMLADAGALMLDAALLSEGRERIPVEKRAMSLQIVPRPTGVSIAAAFQF